MYSLVEAFREGGSAMYAILVFDGLACSMIVLVLVATIVLRSLKMGGAAGIVAWLALVCAALPCCTGVWASFSAKDRVDEILLSVDPEQREILKAEGYKEAEWPMYFGLGSGALLFMAALVPFAVGISAKKPLPPEPGY
jgi:hypothetical protein